MHDSRTINIGGKDLIKKVHKPRRLIIGWDPREESIISLLDVLVVTTAKWSVELKITMRKPNATWSSGSFGLRDM